MPTLVIVSSAYVQLLLRGQPSGPSCLGLSPEQPWRPAYPTRLWHAMRREVGEGPQSCLPFSLQGDSAFWLRDHSSRLDSREDPQAAWPPWASVSPNVNPEADLGFLSGTSLSRPPPRPHVGTAIAEHHRAPDSPALSWQEVCHPAGPCQFQEGDDRPRVRDAALPALLPQVQGGAAVDAGHGDSLHLQVSGPHAGLWGAQSSYRFRRPTRQSCWSRSLWLTSDHIKAKEGTTGSRYMLCLPVPRALFRTWVMGIMCPDGRVGRL